MPNRELPGNMSQTTTPARRTNRRSARHILEEAVNQAADRHLENNREVNNRLGNSGTTYDIGDATPDPNVGIGIQEDLPQMPNPENGEDTSLPHNGHVQRTYIDNQTYSTGGNWHTTLPNFYNQPVNPLPRPERIEGGELTYGQKAVGLSFNPGNRPDVQELKQMYADIIDTLHLLRIQATGEATRHYSVAITETETAQMRAIKALTWVN